jgi:glycosyl hydrolase family 85
MKKSLLLLAGFAAVSLMADAQQIAEGYVTWPESSELPAYIKAWNGGKGAITIDGKTWEDEEFFISRVKPRERFYNTSSQVRTNLSQYDRENNPNGNDKRVCWWVPLGYNDDGTNGLPNGKFDSEAFSMWNYLDHYGNWTSPYGWAPGAFADAAHKNGVAVSGVASVPFGGISDTWRSCLSQMTGVSAEEAGKFFYYHGVDGVGYNSEWSGFSPTSSGLTTLHNGLKAYMSTRNPLWEIIWYGGTMDGGSCSFDRGTSGSEELFKGASMFLNYNYVYNGYNNSAISYAKSLADKSPFHIYAGNNMQGGEPRSGDNYPYLATAQLGIGFWGAHSVNMFWQDRTLNGSADLTKQRTYINTIEKWFTNGQRNPAVFLPIKLNRSHRPTDDWAGVSSMMSARSVLSWNLEEEPFITYFNLGNGQFFNYKGERVNNNGWYSLGVQDYLPTWRWWLAPSYMATNIDPESVSLEADFTWDDAYFGGSCLQVTGSSENEYLHLFKTNFELQYDQVITLRYKILEGSANVDLVFSTSGNPTQEIDENLNIVTTADSEEKTDASYIKGWQIVTFTVGEDFYPEDIVDDGGLGVIALHFSDAKNLKFLLGELSITSPTPTATPKTPVVKLAKVLSNNFMGVDAKLIWSMENNRPQGEPVYNSDVNTSMFRLWAQQEGCEPQMMGVTTSWAGIEFSAANNHDAAQRMRFGVSALSVDMKSESEVAWSEYLDLGEYVLKEDIAIDKGIIKPNEEFTLSFSDPQHAEGTWVLSDAKTGTEVWRGQGKSVTCSGLPEVGAYNLDLTSNGASKQYIRYVSISPVEVGALPQIYSLSVDGAPVDETTGEAKIQLNDSKTFSYTGRDADGSASRGVDLNENWFGVNVGELNIQANKSFSVAAWVKYNEIPKGRSNFITIEDRENGGWPYCHWDFFWSRVTEEGRFTDGSIDTSWGMRMGSGTEGLRLFYKYAESKIDVGAWTHVAIVFEHNENGAIRQKFYINGELQKVTAWIKILKSTAETYFSNNTGGDWSQLEMLKNLVTSGNYGEDTYEPGFVTNDRPIQSSQWIAFGGMAQNITAVKGCVDDFQVWGKAMTQEDVDASMAGLDANNLPDDVLGFWNLEEETVEVEDENSATGAKSAAFIGHAGKNAKNQSPKARYWNGESINGKEGAMTKNFLAPAYLTGCPFLSGTAYPIVTKPTWTAQRAQIDGDGTGAAGEADIKFVKEGDYAVKLTLANGHGEDSRTYPVISVSDYSAIDQVASDETTAVDAYTEHDLLFVEFANDGRYTVEVYNTAGMLAAAKTLDVVAGQNAQIGLATKGVYLVKISLDGKVLRTVKVINK